MASTFYGFEITRKALMVAQKSLDLTGHNIANANTPGYTRQRLTTYGAPADSASGAFTAMAKGQVGSGVEVDQLTQIRDAFLDRQYRSENTSLNRWTVTSNALQYIEDIFHEPSNESLSGVTGDFFNKLQELVKNPESQEIRTLVRQNAVMMTDILHRYSIQLQELSGEQDYSLRVGVDRVNTYGQKIASLNEDIVKFELSGEKANDLRDRRNVILDQLSEMVDVDIQEDSDGKVNVSIGGVPFVDYNQVHSLKIEDSADGTANVVWDSDGGTALIAGGKLAGYLDIRDGAGPGGNSVNTAMGIPYYRKQLDDFAEAFVQEFNQTNAMGKLLGSGLPGSDLFTGTTAADIELSQQWKDDVFAVAASSTGEAADNSNALQLAALRDKQTSIGIFEEYIGSMVSDLAVNASYHGNMEENGQILLNSLENQRQSVSQVSLDEEMANMVKYQQTYAAAARMMTTIDEALDILINKTGLVGR